MVDNPVDYAIAHVGERATERREGFVGGLHTEASAKSEGAEEAKKPAHRLNCQTLQDCPPSAVALSFVEVAIGKPVEGVRAANWRALRVCLRGVGE